MSAAAPGPTCGEPELVMQQPFGGPGHGRQCEMHVISPFTPEVQAQGVVFVGVGQLGRRRQDELRCDDGDDRASAQLVGDGDGVQAAQR